MCVDGVAVAARDLVPGDVVLRYGNDVELPLGSAAGPATWDADQLAVAAVSLDFLREPAADAPELDRESALIPGLAAAVPATQDGANVQVQVADDGAALVATRAIPRGAALARAAEQDHAMMLLARYGESAPESALAPLLELSRSQQLQLYGDRVAVLDALACAADGIVRSRVGAFDEECRQELLGRLDPRLASTERYRRTYAYYAYLCAGKLARYSKVEAALARLRGREDALSQRLAAAAADEIARYQTCQDDYAEKLQQLPASPSRPASVVPAPAYYFNTAAAAEPPPGEGWLPRRT